MYDINQYKISCFETECAQLVVALILIDLKIHVHTFWSLESSFWKPISVDDPQQPSLSLKCAAAAIIYAHDLFILYLGSNHLLNLFSIELFNKTKLAADARALFY